MQPSGAMPLLAGAVAIFLGSPAHAQSADPIKIGVIAEVQSIAGAATPGGAQIAADEINAKGGVLGRRIEIVTYDNKSSSADSVRAFRARSARTRSRPSSQAISVKSCWRSSPGRPG